MSGEILFLAHRIPFPPDRGDKIRSHHILKRLAQLAPVHVACFAENTSDLANEGELATVTASHKLVDRKKSLMLAGVEALLHRKPVSLPAFESLAIKNFVTRLIAEKDIDLIYVFSGQMGQYIPLDFKGQVIVDLVDVDSAKFDAYAQDTAWPMSWVNRREGRLLKLEEQRLAERADDVLLVSAAEVDLLRTRLKGDVASSKKIRALGNGINFNFFNPALVPPEPAMARKRGPHYVFTGQMDYPPNIAAALRGIERLLPAIRAVQPEAEFHVVGRNPTAELRAYDGKNGCRVWGEVADIRPFLASADCVLVPLEIARGVQNKVLEAMAMACPVVMTSQAATGIGGAAGKHYYVADSDEDFVSAALDAVNPESRLELGDAARRFVVENLSWPAILAPLDAMVKTGHRQKQIM